ncbi:CrcB family protein [Microbacterium sp.]|uniref:fluoride efflux transporter FluC n=1 Tax=Microbacterium sp. TaxID=51671 RepID=UPI002617B8A5|nr:CrcB family protein [Microbacterium sp.]
MIRRLLLVLLGGTLGTAARLAIALLIPDSAAGFPLATLIVNAFGALLIGVLAARVQALSELRIFFGTGVLGGFTTYSALAVGTVELWTDAPFVAASYALASLAVGVGAAVLGERLGRRRPR